MESKKINQQHINKVRKAPKKYGLLFEEYGKSSNIDDYTDTEISEMIYGAYEHKKMLLADENYFIDLTMVTEIICDLGNVSYLKKIEIKEKEESKNNSIINIKAFYIKDYWLITKGEICGITKHKITNFFHKIGVMTQGKGNHQSCYVIDNDYQSLQKFEQGLFPKDLFHPVKLFINRFFFKDDYRISNFRVDHNFILEK